MQVDKAEQDKQSAVIRAKGEVHINMLESCGPQDRSLLMSSVMMLHL